MVIDDSRRWRQAVWGYLVVVAVAEIVGSIWSVPAGVVCHGLLLLGIVNHYAVASRDQAMDGCGRALECSSSTLPVLALVPTLRIASLTVPSEGVSPIVWYAVVGLALTFGVVLTARLVGARGADLGLRWTSTQPLVALLGVPLAAVTYTLPHAEPTIESGDWRYVVMASVVLFLLGALEEVVFRGMIQRSLCQLFGAHGVVLTAMLSTVSAIGSGSLGRVAFGGVVGLVFGGLVYRTQSLVGVAVAHGIVNVTAIVLRNTVLQGFLG